MTTKTKPETFLIESRWSRAPLRFSKPKRCEYVNRKKKTRVVYGRELETSSERIIIGTDDEKLQDEFYTNSPATTVLGNLIALGQGGTSNDLIFPSLYAANKACGRPHGNRAEAEFEELLEILSKLKMVVVDKSTNRFRRVVPSALKSYGYNTDGQYEISVNEKLIHELKGARIRINTTMLKHLQHRPSAQQAYIFLAGISKGLREGRSREWHVSVRQIRDRLALNSDDRRYIRKCFQHAIDRINQYSDLNDFTVTINWIKNKGVAKLTITNIGTPRQPRLRIKS